MSGAFTDAPAPPACPQRTAICFADQFNGAQANQYLVLTQTEGERVVVQGVGVGTLVTGAALPLELKQGGDVACALGTVATLAATGMFDLSQVSQGRQQGRTGSTEHGNRFSPTVK